MSGLEPTYTNIIKQELEIGDLRQAVALVTGKLERLQQFVDRSEWGQERERLNARITELERDLEGCHRSNAALLVCGTQNCEPYRELQSRLAEVEQRAGEDRIIMAMGGDQTEWYARQLATAQEQLNVAIIKREQVIAWRRQDQKMIDGLFQQLAEWDERIKELERTLAAQRPPEPTRSACGHFDCNEEDCYGK